MGQLFAGNPWQCARGDDEEDCEGKAVLQHRPRYYVEGGKKCR